MLSSSLIGRRSKTMAAWIGFLPCLVLAQTNIGPVVPRFNHTQTYAWNLSWLNESWTAQGTPPYAAFRKRIDALGTRSANGDIGARREIVSLAARYRDASAKLPSDPLLLFQHLYAAYMAGQRSSELRSQVGLSEGVERLKRLAPPHTYEYGRLLFVLDTVPLDHHTMWALGERLLKFNSEDRRVTHLLASRLVPSNSPDERRAALAMSDRLVQHWPDNPRSYTVKGGVYYELYVRFRRHTDGLSAIENYDEYLRRSRPDDPERRDIEGIVACIKGWLKDGKERL